METSDFGIIWYPLQNGCEDCVQEIKPKSDNFGTKLEIIKTDYADLKNNLIEILELKM